MKKIILSTVIICSLLIAGCKDDDEGTGTQAVTNLNLNIAGQFDGEVLQMQKEYNFCDGRLVKFTTFSFFVSEIVLLREDDPETSVTELKEVEFVNLSFTDEADASAGQNIAIQNVPAGTYSGIKLGLGVAADLNRTKPEDYGTSSPLSDPDFHWSGWSSYIFAKLDGFADLNNDGIITQGGLGSEGMSYHTGSDMVYKEVTITKDIVLEESTDGSINLKIDIANAFDISDPVYDENGDGCLDIESYNGTHSDASLEIADQIMDNLRNSIKMEL